jgi:alkanesulfonate monooxygenase SsuD/methylene tetrahydromethanopterin reductase-like flavin-dependent oxidoreductase (luciferase family)
LQIILPMLAGERPSFTGKHYRTQEAMAEPRFREHVPLLIGGSGEKKTIPFAVEHFDHLNLTSGFDELPRKLDAIAARCDDVGRDPATLETSMLITAYVTDDAGAVTVPEARAQRTVVGTAVEVAEQIRTKVFDAGLTGVILNMPTNVTGYVPGAITALGEALRPLIAD